MSAIVDEAATKAATEGMVGYKADGEVDLTEIARAAAEHVEAHYLARERALRGAQIREGCSGAWVGHCRGCDGVTGACVEHFESEGEDSDEVSLFVGDMVRRGERVVWVRDPRVTLTGCKCAALAATEQP